MPGTRVQYLHSRGLLLFQLPRLPHAAFDTYTVQSDDNPHVHFLNVAVYITFTSFFFFLSNVPSLFHLRPRSPQNVYLRPQEQYGS